MLEQQLGLADAYALISSDKGAALTAKEWNWPQVVQRFKELKISSGEISDRTWHRNYRLKIDRALQVLNGNPKPASAKELMRSWLSGGSCTNQQGDGCRFNTWHGCLSSRSRVRGTIAVVATRQQNAAAIHRH